MVHSAEDGSIPVPDMSALIARLEAAEAGSQELDAEIAVGTRWPPIGNVDHWVNDEEMEVRERGAIGFKNLPGNPAEWSSPPLTTSLDAALALAERLGLDGFHTVYAALMNWKAHDPRGPASQTLPLALCIAILKAKAQGEGG